MPSRQVKWQKRKIEQGRCVSCGQPPIDGGTRCFRHYAMRRLAALGFTAGVGKQPTKAFLGQREMLLARLQARYTAIKEGNEPSLMETPTQCWAAVGVTVKTMKRLRDLDTYLQFVVRLDERAVRMRKENHASDS